MSSRKRKRLDSTVAAIQRRYGDRALQQGVTMTSAPLPPHTTTGFPALDAMTGCQGIPLGVITLLSGRMTSGKLTLAYKALAHAQGAKQQDAVALIDLNGSSDPDYLTRCGVALPRLFLIRPTAETAMMPLLIDLIGTGQLRLILVDSLPDLLARTSRARQLQNMVSPLLNALHRSCCALVFLEEWMPNWVRALGFGRNPLAGQAALHIELRRERWLSDAGQMTGYEAEARILRSRWARSGQRTTLGITFNGTVKARTTW